MRKSPFRMPGQQILAAAVLLAFAGPALAAQPTLRQRVRADPRAAHVATMTPDERLAFARDYGLESLLPRPDATTRTVTNCNDSGSGSLRAAVAASASGDIVDASALACSTISLTTGAIDIGVDSLVIKGPDPAALKVGNGSKYYHRVFNHTGAGTLTLSGMTVTKGTIRTGGTDPGSTGGCINSAGTVVLGNLLDPANRRQGVVVSDCTAISTQNVNAMGGGIYARSGVRMFASVVSGCSVVAQGVAQFALGGGVATPFGDSFEAKYSEVRDNQATGAHASGGGIFAPYVASTTIEHSTIAGNDSSGVIGGAYVGSGRGGGIAEIESSTISGNTSSIATAGVRVNVVSGQVHGSIRIASTTISDNHCQGSGSAFGGGAELLGGSIDLQSTIISGNTCDGHPSDVAAWGSSVTVTGANNLFGAADSSMPAAIFMSSNAPGLAPLANNRGLTRTHALLPGSPAIDHGNNSAENNYDQRGAGHPRVIGAAADIGAFERDPDVIFYNGFE